jgi:hypothetical protein
MERANIQQLYSISNDSQVCFYPFIRPPEHKQQEWRVGLEGSSLAIELPEEGARAIQHLLAGQTLAEASVTLQQEFGDAVDVSDLVQELAQLGFVEHIGIQEFKSPEMIGQRWLQAIPVTWIAWFYSRPALTAATVLILLGPLLLLFDPTLRPQTQDLLWSFSYTLDLVVLLFIGPALILKHESGHLLAARAKGLPAELTFGHRLFCLVAISRIGEIWKCGRFDRIVIYCAGIATNGITASLCLLIIFVCNRLGIFLPISLKALLRFLALSEYLGIAWQFQIFLKTDFYHLIADLTNRHALPDQAAMFLRSVWLHIFHWYHKRHNERQKSWDMLASGYAILDVIGNVLSLLLRLLLLSTMKLCCSE